MSSFAVEGKGRDANAALCFWGAVNSRVGDGRLGPLVAKPGCGGIDPDPTTVVRRLEFALELQT